MSGASTICGCSRVDRAASMLRDADQSRRGCKLRLFACVEQEIGTAEWGGGRQFDPQKQVGIPRFCQPIAKSSAQTRLCSTIRVEGGRSGHMISHSSTQGARAGADGSQDPS